MEKVQTTNTENKFEYNSLIYIAVEGDGCKLCYFNSKSGCKVPLSNIPYCSNEERADKRSVVFVLSDIDNEGEDK